VSECDREASIREGNGPTTGRSTTHTKKATCIAEAVQDTELLTLSHLFSFRCHKPIGKSFVN
jgi:hypothetical protein